MKRRTRATATVVALAVATTATLTVTSLAGASPSVATPTPVGINAARVKDAVAKLPGLVRTDMADTKVPGVATAVVYDGKVVYASGFGVREYGKPAKVDVNTVFQLASVSKPITSSAISAAATKGQLSWTDPVRKGLPGFTLKDPYVGANATLADMYEHRSGLPEHAGDILEDLGFSQSAIFSKLRQQPLTPFRTEWAYTNYGLSAAGESAANRVGKSFESFAQSEIFRPLGMTSTSTTFAALSTRKDRAALHTRVGQGWKSDLSFDLDSQAPAGGVSSSVTDLTKWVTMLLNEGKANGRQLIAKDQLLATWAPTIPRGPVENIGDRSGFYGLGWNVGDDALGRVVVDHSGAFATGAAPNVLLVPEAKLGIITLTNAAPVGLPEAINRAFLDDATYGKQTLDWLKVFKDAFAPLLAQNTQYSKPPKVVKPARATSALVGNYASSYWGPLTLTSKNGKLSFRVGPQHQTYALRHYTGDTWWFDQRGESGTGQSGFTFAGTTAGGKAKTITIQAWNTTGLGTFTRVR